MFSCIQCELSGIIDRHNLFVKLGADFTAYLKAKFTSSSRNHTIDAMHIGIDARLLYYRIGGISRYVIQLVEALAALDDDYQSSGDYQYSVFHSRKDRQDYTPEQVNFVRRRLWTPCHHRFERWLLSAELLGQKLDILHSPDFIPPLRGGRRHVITVHDLSFLYYPQFLTKESRRYYAEQIEWAVEHADGIIADSEHTRQDLVRELGVSPQRVKTVYLAADPQFSRIADKASAGEVAETLSQYHLNQGFILFVGTIEPRKNISFLLEAYALLRRQSASAPPLLLVGSMGWLFDETFATIESYGLEAHVRHLQQVSDRHLAHLYLAAGLLALPSYYEGFGLPALEAMHCRCPVIASNRASLPEVVGQAGILLNPDDPESWAASMQKVLQDPELRTQMAAGGVEQARKFSWERTAKATRSVYEQLA